MLHSARLPVCLAVAILSALPRQSVVETRAGYLWTYMPKLACLARAATGGLAEAQGRSTADQSPLLSSTTATATGPAVPSAESSPLVQA